MIFQVTDKDEAETETGKEVIEEEGTVEAGNRQGRNRQRNRQRNNFRRNGPV